MGGIVAATLGFQWIFLIDAFTCLTAAYIVRRYLSGKPKTDQVSASQGGEDRRENLPRDDRGLSAYNDGWYLIFIGLVALYAIAFFQLFTSVPVFLKREWGFTESSIGLLMALNGAIIVLFEMPFMKYMEHFQRYMVMISLGCLFLFAGFGVLLLKWGGLSIAVIFILLMSMSEMFAMPFMTNYAISRPGEGRRGQYMALYAMD